MAQKDPEVGADALLAYRTPAGTKGRPEDPEGLLARVGALLEWDMMWRIRELTTDPKKRRK